MTKSPVPTKDRPMRQLRKNARVRKCDPVKEILNTDLIMRAIEECLAEKDFEGILEVVDIYREAQTEGMI